MILLLRPKRYRCPYCDGGVTTTERHDWYDAKAGCTKVYAEFLLLELVNSTIQDVSKKHGVTYDVVRGALNHYVKGEVDWSQIKVLRILGLDEISLLKGHRDFVTIVSTQDKNGNPILLAVLKGREKQTVVDFLKTIPKRLRKGIEEVCSDLYEGFINAVEEVLPNAKVVADRFHVANPAFTNGRGESYGIARNVAVVRQFGARYDDKPNATKHHSTARRLGPG